MKTGLPPIVDHSSRILILGTMPGQKSIAAQQYYANRGNHFWKILFSVFDEAFAEDYPSRTALLAKYRIGLWNVLACCQREGSGDKSIRSEHANDFADFFKTYRDIEFVFFESKAAQRFYDKHLMRFESITYDCLPSVSGLNARLSFDQKLAGWKKLGLVTPNDVKPAAAGQKNGRPKPPIIHSTGSSLEMISEIENFAPQTNSSAAP